MKPLALSLLTILYLYSQSGWCDNFYFNTDGTRYCDSLQYETGVTKMAECMEKLSNKGKEEYNQTYNKLTEKLYNEKKRRGFRDFNKFIKALAEAKANFDDYMESECKTLALATIKDSDDYKIIYSRCKISLYSQRIIFYNNYQY